MATSISIRPNSNGLKSQPKQPISMFELGSSPTLVSEAMAFMFEKLEVYQRAVCLSEKITRLTENFPSKGYYHLVDQLRRASLSICLNIAEGNGRWHPKDRKNFFWIARGSIFECVPLVELCRRQKLITEETCAELKDELEALARMMTALIRGVDRRGEQRGQTQREEE